MERIPASEAEIINEIWEEEWASNLADAAIERVKRRVGAKQFQMFDLYVTQQWLMELVKSTLAVSAAQVYLAKHRVGRAIKAAAEDLEADWNRWNAELSKR